MRICFMSDIHGNLPALLEAYRIARERGAERFIVAGDLVGDGPFPAETVAALMTTPQTEAIRGNVDRKVLRRRDKGRKKLARQRSKGGAKRQNRVWSALELSKEQADWLGSLPRELDVAIEGRSVLVVHGSPLGDSDYIYPSITSDALQGKLANRDGAAPALLVSGHSHIPFARAIGGTTVVNCGSVGRPADGDPRGSLAIVDLFHEASTQAEIVRFAYAVEEVVAAIREREVPGIEPAEYERGVKT